MHKTVILLVGPTAVGKTALALQIAEQYGTAIFSADSRQCYSELNIGVAKPTPLELARVPHYFINTHTITEDVDAAQFEYYALEKVAELFQINDVVVMAGGTGLYVQSFCEGLDVLPAIAPAVRKKIREAYTVGGMSWLSHALQQADPLFAEKGEMQNPQRMMRALEVMESSGQSLLSFQSNQKAKRPFRIIKVGLDLPREKLYGRINERVDAMMQMGLLEEVDSLKPYAKYNALQTVGYKELFAHFEGSISLEVAIEQIKQHTRNYAKRQLTWFRKDEAITWFSPEAPDAIIQWLREELAR